MNCQSASSETLNGLVEMQVGAIEEPISVIVLECSEAEYVH